MVKGHLFQDECWAGHPGVGVHFNLLWLRRLAKEKEKALKEKKGILAHLFLKIKEIRRKVR